MKSDLLVTPGQWTLSLQGLVAIAALDETFRVTMQLSLGQSDKSTPTCDSRGDGDPCRLTQCFSLYTQSAG